MKRFRDFTILLTVSPYSDNALTEFVRVLNFPVNPFAILSVGGDINKQSTGPLNARRQDPCLDIINGLRLVWIARIDRGVTNFHSATRQQILDIAQASVVLMDVTDEDMFPILGHDFPPYSRYVPGIWGQGSVIQDQVAHLLAIFHQRLINAIHISLELRKFWETLLNTLWIENLFHAAIVVSA